MQIITHEFPSNRVLKNILKNPFSELEKMDATIHRLQDGRKTISFMIENQIYFAKIHEGVGWKEIFKNLFQLRWPIISAEPEWKALLKLKKLNIDAPAPVAFGKKNINPAHVKSFILTKALENTINLDEFFSSEASIDFRFKQKLIKTVAKIARTLHENGINHRDFYLCHFLLDKATLTQLDPKIYLIDLHRAQIREKVPVRWRVKDIGGLYFSTMNFNFTKRDYLRFIRYFTGEPLQKTFKKDYNFWKAVVIRADRLYKNH